MSVDQHIYRHVNRQSTDMVINTWLKRRPIVPTSTQPRGAQITQDLLFQGQFTCWNFTLKSLQLVGGDVNKPTMQNTFRRSEQLHTCQKPCQKRNRLTGLLTGVSANIFVDMLVDTPADISDECRPTYLSTCQPTVNRYGDQYLTETSTDSANQYSTKGCTNYTRFAVSRSIHLLEFYPKKPSVSWRGCKQTNHAKYL